MSTESNTPRTEGEDTSADDTRPVPVAGSRPVDESRRRILSRERDEFGGVKVGSAFFGWLAATGMAVLLTALAAAAGAAIGITTGSVAEVASAQGTTEETVGLVGGIALLVILFVAYYCGGFVAGRMARFDGLKQGLAVLALGGRHRHHRGCDRLGGRLEIRRAQLGERLPAHPRGEW